MPLLLGLPREFKMKKKKCEQLWPHILSELKRLSGCTVFSSVPNLKATSVERVRTVPRHLFLIARNGCDWLRSGSLSGCVLPSLSVLLVLGLACKVRNCIFRWLRGRFHNAGAGQGSLAKFHSLAQAPARVWPARMPFWFHREVDRKSEMPFFYFPVCLFLFRFLRGNIWTNGESRILDYGRRELSR